MDLMKTLAAMLVLVTASSYGADAVITGPEQTKAGQMFVLDGGNSIGDHFHWVVDPRLELESGYIECNSKFATSVTVHGTFYFHYVASDAEGISVATHTIKIEGGTTAPDPDEPTDPDEPDQPDPTPEPDFKDLVAASKQAALATGDKVTAVRLVTALKGMTLDNNLATAKNQVANAVEGVLLTRGPNERSKDWLTWRKAVNTEIDKLNLTTTPDYAKAMRAVVDTLVEVGQATVSANESSYSASEAVIVTMLSPEYGVCPRCDEWKVTELGKLGPGCYFKTAKGQAASYPSFVIQYKGNLYSLSGPRTGEEIMSVVNHLRNGG